MAASPNNIIVFDLETGGTSYAKDHGIVDGCFIKLDGDSLEEIGRYETGLIAPYTTKRGNPSVYTPGAEQVHGIPESKLRMEGKNAETVAQEIMNFIAGGKVGRQKPVMCGHNSDNFDIPFLEDFLAAFKWKLIPALDDMTIDTMKWARFRWPSDIANHKLATCCREIGYTLVDAHSATPDTEATAALAKYFISSMRGGSSGVEIGSKSYREQFTFPL